MRKVYFAGSIRASRADAGLYSRMIRHIRNSCLVLTEHVGRDHLVLEENEERDRSIYLQDCAWLRECDLVIAECTCPSLGVGYELCMAERLGKPCHILYDRDRIRLSAMLLGNGYFSIHPYSAKDDILKVLDQILKEQA